MPLHLRVMLQQLVIVAGVIVLSMAASFAGQDWPEFRGPAGQGHATVARLPLEWSATRNIAWKQSVPGRGWSSPVLAGERLFEIGRAHV